MRASIPSTLETALQFVAQGVSVIPLNGKIPAIPWKRFQTELPDEARIREWFGNRSKFNVGIVTGSSKLTVADFDSKKMARAAYRRFGKKVFSVLCETKRGIHAYFQYHPDIKTTTGRIDWRNDGGLVVGPGSQVAGHRYRWVKNHEFRDLSDLSKPPAGLLPKPATTLQTRTGDQIQHVRKYLATIESIQGQQGNKAMYRAACKCWQAGLSEAEATIELLHWNESGNAQPPWSPNELARAITSAYRSKK